MYQENLPQAFYDAMQKVKSYTATEELLVFDDGNGKNILWFTKKK